MKGRKKREHIRTSKKGNKFKAGKREYDQIVVDGKWVNEHPTKHDPAYAMIKGRWRMVYYKVDHSGEYRTSPKPSAQELKQKREIDGIIKANWRPMSEIAKRLR